MIKIYNKSVIILLILCIIILSCSGFDWETLEKFKFMGYCFESRNQLNGVWNREVMEINLLDNCSKPDVDEELIRIEGSDRDSKSFQIDDALLLTYTFSNNDDWIKNAFLFNFNSLPENQLLLDRYFNFSNQKILEVDTLETTNLKVLDFNEHKILIINWHASFYHEPEKAVIDFGNYYNNMFLLNVNHCKFDIIKKNEFRGIISWKDVSKTDTLTFFLPEDFSSYVRISTGIGR